MLTVVTIGNPMRGDDGAGPAVAQRLRERGVAVVEVEEPTRLVGLVPPSGTLLVVDAVISGAPVGSVVVLDVTNDSLPTSVSTSSHTISLAQGLELARALDEWPDRVLIVGLEVGEMHPEPGLHEEIAAAVEVAADMIASLAAVAE